MKPIDPRLLRYSQSSRGFLLVTVLLAIFSALTTIAQAFLLADLICKFFQKSEAFLADRNELLILVSVFILRAVVAFITDRMAAKASSKIRNELRMQVMASTLTGGSDEVHRLGTAGLSLLITKGIDNLDGYFSKFLPQLFIAVIVPVTVGVIIAFQDWRSGLIVLCTLPLIPIFGILIGKFTAGATAKKWQTLGVLGGHFLDLLNGLTTLKVYGRHKIQSAKLKEVGDKYRDETMKVLKISFLSSLALELVATLSVALLAVSIGLRLVSGSLSLFTGLFILVIAPEVYWPIRQVATFFHAAADGLSAFTELFKLLDLPTPLVGKSFKKVSAISWSDLLVEFPNRGTVKIPAGQISSGSLHVLIGPSGSGKSTLANILLRFQEPTSGQVLISTDQGNIPLSQIDKRVWQSQISWLAQEPRFPVGTVAQILRHAKPSASDFELVEVLSAVDLDIAELSSGLGTMLGTIKAPLSIGQQRKITLARALLKDAQILVLDEPTASVDDVSEELISKLLTNQALSGKLILLISHRTSMISDATSVTDMARVK